MKTLIIGLAVLLMTACSNKKPDDVVAVKVGDEYYQVDDSASRSLEGKTEDKVVCKRRIVTGSHRKEKICTTQAQLDRERAAAEKVMDENRSFENRKIIQEHRGN
ncbi:MAG: hypothetical protein DWP95_00865 [Proteobacteria bacterium]|nr:MAG: hypothetical protein DWP95_00865 [Pseudomonadota bacterium]